MKENWGEIVYADLSLLDGGGFRIEWGIENCGFGEFTLFQRDGEIRTDSETMDVDTIVALFRHAITPLMERERQGFEDYVEPKQTKIVGIVDNIIGD